MLYHQTVSPSVCSCVYEEQFEYDEVLKQPTGQPSLWFFHNVCERHLPLISNKPAIKKADLDKKRQDIANHQLFLLQKNRERHLKDFDEHPQRKKVKEILVEMKNSPDKVTRDGALRVENQIATERLNQEHFLDGHEDKSMNQLLVGIHSPHAFNAQEVYDTIQQEFRQANG